MALNIPMHQSKSSTINDKMKKETPSPSVSLVIERRRSFLHWRVSLESCNVTHRPNTATAFKQSCSQTAGFDRHQCLVSQRRLLPCCCCCCCAVNFFSTPQRHCLLYLLCTFISAPVPSNARKCHALAKSLPDHMLSQLLVVLTWPLKFYCCACGALFLFKNEFCHAQHSFNQRSSLISAHLLRSTRRSLVGDAMHVSYLQAACLWHTSPMVSHGFCLSSISNIFESPNFASFTNLQACTLSPRSRL